MNVARPEATLLSIGLKKVTDLDIEGSGQFDDRREGRAALATDDLRQMPLRKIRFKVKAVQRAVLLDSAPQPSAE
jgi:hypothetical protein